MIRFDPASGKLTTVQRFPHSMSVGDAEPSPNGQWSSCSPAAVPPRGSTRICWQSTWPAARAGPLTFRIAGERRGWVFVEASALIGMIAAILGIGGVTATSAIAQTFAEESEAARASHAHADAEALLSDLQLPEGALLASSDPSVGQGLTVSRAPGPGQALADRFWRVPAEPLEVIAWLEAHGRPGSSPFIHTLGLVPPPEDAATGFRFPPRRSAADYEEELLIYVLPAEGGGTAVRVEGVVAFLPVRPGSERVPAHVKLIRIVQHKTDVTHRPHHLSASRTIRKPAVVKNVIAAVEALKRHATPLSGGTECGHFVRRTTIEVQFRGSSQAEPLAKLTSGPRCGPSGPSLRMWVGPREEPNLTDSTSLEALLQSLLD